MLRLKRTFRIRKKPGLPPGSLVYVGEKKVEKAEMALASYDLREAISGTPATPEEARGLLAPDKVNWLIVTGVHDGALVRGLGETFGFHPLLLEDVMNTGQRPKLEEYGEDVFLVLKMARLDEPDLDLGAEQISMVFREGLLVCFQEQPNAVVESVLSRMRAGRGRIRGAGTDYLAYCLLDAVVDHAFVTTEQFGDVVFDLQQRVLDDPGPEVLSDLLQLRTKLVSLRRDVWPLRDAVHAFIRSRSGTVGQDVQVFLRDVLDHSNSVIDACQAHIDMLQSLVDIYLSSVGNRTNEVMRVLTIIATIFIPLTFLVGVYGMNFEYMPELRWRWGYFAVWGIMAGVFVAMLLYFRKKRWL
ncbi:MAG: magnesium/cobalt transporter CorA [Desulfatibacillaceae bacterium]